MTQGEENLIISAMHIFQAECYLNSVRHGFWHRDDNNLTDDTYTPDYLGSKIALMHSELSEALEALRKRKLQQNYYATDKTESFEPKDEHCPQFESLTIELADCIIRILDFAEALRLPLGEAMIAKFNFNASREFKHGKAF